MGVGELTTARDSIAAVVRERAQACADGVVFRFLDAHDDGGPASLTFAELDARAAAVAGALREHVRPGDRVLLLCAPGPAYVTALFGCLHAGAIAVPAYPPLAAGAAERLRRLLADADPAVVLTTASLAPLYASSGLDALVADAGAVRLEAGRLDSAGTAVRHPARPGDVAVLQYTSGSTGAPRGVVLTHANLLANVAAMLEWIGGAGPDDRGVSWLPPYHDMGLIGGILMPVVAGCETVLLSPLTFLRRPLAWLEAISEHRGTVSGGPNFAYDLCVDRSTPDQVATLDLGSWRIAVNGAEPVRARTLARFAGTFAPAGFRPQTMAPAYGLAEATLMVTAAVGPAGSAEGNGSAAVSLGPPVAETTVAIVDPQTRRRCAVGEIGEIWLQGPGVAAGYWSDPATSADVFAATIADEPAAGTFLRSGDLGSLSGGELYVAGRLKDVIIVRGQNHYPQDLEETASAADPRLRPGCAAAFQLEDDDRVVLVQECREADPAAAGTEIAEAVRRAVAREHGVSLAEVVLIARGTSSKTSSGKIRRAATRDAYLARALDVVTAHRFGEAADAARTPGDEDAAARIAALFGEVLACAAGADDDFFALGGDSLKAVELATVAEERGLAIRPEDLYDATTPRALARVAAAREPTTRDAAAARALLAPIPRVADAASHPLSPIQRRWALDYLGDRSKTWGNMTLRIPLPDGGDAGAATTAIAHVWSAHEALRTTFPLVDGELRQRICRDAEIPVVLCDVRDRPPDERAAAAAELMAAEAATVFDLAAAPAARAAVVRSADDRAELHLTMHHMLGDGWSLMALRRQLLDGYEAARAGASLAVPSPAVRYRDYAAWLRALEDGDVLADARDYWLTELDGDLPDTLPVDDAVARGPHAGGAHVLRILPTELATAVKRRASSSRRSVTALLYAALFAALQRRTGQHDLIVGTPLAGRERRDVRDVMGMFINLVPLRVRFRRDWELGDLVDAVQAKLLGAMAHQRYQLDRVVDDLGVTREPHRFPITRTFFTKLDMGGQGLGPQEGYETSGKLATDVRFDLMLYAYDFTDGLVLDCKYRDVLFTREEVADLVDGCVTVLREAVGE